MDRKEAARQGLIDVAKEADLGDTALWTRVNSLESPWVLDDLTQLVTEIGHKLEVIMVPKVEGPWDIHYVDRLLAQLEAKAELERPLLIHAILETGMGVVNLEEIATASPRMQGMSFGPADLAASRRMKTTRVGGGHPGYRVIEDPDPDDPDAPRAMAQQDPWHYSIARMVDACTSAGILPFYGPYGDIKDTDGCETQFRAAFLLGCVGAWSLHPVQIEIAKKVFSPDPDEVAFAKKVIEAIPDGRGVHMIDGKMQDDATWKQCKVMVELAEQLAEKDPELAEAYGSRRPPRASPQAELVEREGAGDRHLLDRRQPRDLRGAGHATRMDPGGVRALDRRRDRRPPARQTATDSAPPLTPPEPDRARRHRATVGRRCAHAGSRVTGTPRPGAVARRLSAVMSGAPSTRASAT